MSSTNRRQFLGLFSAAALSSGFVPYLYSSEQPTGEGSDRLRVGCIGLGGQGKRDAQGFSRLADVIAICDVDSQFGLASSLNNPQIGRLRNGEKIGQPDTYKDYRRILDRNDIDVVSIGTTDHWHVKIAIEALQAGKHVHCQKPLTLTLEEGQLMRQACRKYPDRVFQVGTQQRSQKKQFACATLMVRKGMLGTIKKLTVDIGAGPVGGPFPKSAQPDALDWDFWLGPCPKVDYIRERTHNSFRWFYEYSGGKFTDWGAHHVDCSQWALGEDGAGCGPVSFKPLVFKHPVPFENGYPTVDDCYNTSHEFEILCTFASGVEMILCSHSNDGNGILFEGSTGRMHVNRERIKGQPIDENAHEQLTEQDYLELSHGKPYEDHKQNFLRCIKEGGQPISDVFSHVQAMQTCHLAAIAARLGREIKWDPKEERILGDDQAASFFVRESRKGYEISRPAS